MKNTEIAATINELNVVTKVVDALNKRDGEHKTYCQHGVELGTIVCANCNKLYRIVKALNEEVYDGR